VRMRAIALDDDNARRISTGIATHALKLADGSHALVARAYDAAGNVGSSSSVAFSVSNGGGSPFQLIGNGGFESGTANWTQTSGVITSSSSEAAHAGSWKA
jgi:hypothetical protein